MNRNNRGFSLVELIVVIAIAAVLIGFVGFSLSFLFGTEAKQAVSKVSGMLNETKTSSMSRFNESMTLTYKEKDIANAIPSDGFYVERTSYTMKQDLNEKKLGTENRKVASPKVIITVYSDTGASTVLGNTVTGKKLTIQYDRSNGSIKKAEISGGGATDTINLSKITFQSGAKTYSIVFTPQTGKHVIQ